MGKPKKVVWKVQGGSTDDDWVMETGKDSSGESKSPDHFPGEKRIEGQLQQDAYWSARPVSAGQDQHAPEWHYQYSVKLTREGCDAITLDPPIYIRRE